MLSGLCLCSHPFSSAIIGNFSHFLLAVSHHTTAGLENTTTDICARKPPSSILLVRQNALRTIESASPTMAVFRSSDHFQRAEACMPITHDSCDLYWLFYALYLSSLGAWTTADSLFHSQLCSNSLSLTSSGASRKYWSMFALFRFGTSRSRTTHRREGR